MANIRWGRVLLVCLATVPISVVIMATIQVPWSFLLVALYGLTWGMIVGFTGITYRR